MIEEERGVCKLFFSDLKSFLGVCNFLFLLEREDWFWSSRSRISRFTSSCSSEKVFLHPWLVVPVQLAGIVFKAKVLESRGRRDFVSLEEKVGDSHFFSGDTKASWESSLLTEVSLLLWDLDGKIELDLSILSVLVVKGISGEIAEGEVEAVG